MRPPATLAPAAGICADLFAGLEAQISAHGFAPAAHSFDAATWAHRGKVLARLMAAACRAEISGTDRRVLDVLALKLLGLQNEPQGRLSAEKVGEHLRVSKRAVELALSRLASLKIITVKRQGVHAEIMLHPSIFKDACGQPASTCGQKPVDMWTTSPDAKDYSHPGPLLPPQTPLSVPTARLVSPPSPQRRQAETPPPHGPPARILTVAVASGRGSPRGPGLRPATTTPATTTAQGGERLRPAPPTDGANDCSHSPPGGGAGWRQIGPAIARAAAACLRYLARPLYFRDGGTP